MKWREVIRAHIRFINSLILLCVSGSVLAGCSKSADSIVSSRSKAFNSASPQTKTAWESASAAAKSHDYATALAGLGVMASDTNLTAEQLQAVREASRALFDEMYAAANKGDENAKKAIEDLRKSMAR